MQQQLTFRQALVFRAVLYLALSITILATLSIAVVYFHQRDQLEHKVLDAGFGLLDSYVNESRGSIAKGQAHSFQDVIDNMVAVHSSARDLHEQGSHISRSNVEIADHLVSVSNQAEEVQGAACAVNQIIVL